MDFRKSTGFHTDIHDFWIQSSILHTSVDEYHMYINVNITLISKQGYPCKDILQMMDIHVFMDISLLLSMLLWISIRIYFDFYGYPLGYPLISMDIHALTCYGFSIQRLKTRDPT